MEAKKMEFRDRTAEFDPADIEKNKLLAPILCLVGLFLVYVIYTLVQNPKSKFNNFWLNQWIWMTIIMLIPLGITQAVASVLMIISLYFMFTGQCRELPYIGEKQIIKWDQV
jgi:hypothetical protein